LNGDWNVFLGQAFSFNPSVHVCKPRPVPEFAPIYMTYDYGYGSPFSIGWWWVDQDDRIYRFSEWYGWDGTPNRGIRMTDSEVAEGVVEREKALGLLGHEVTRLCDPTCFNKKPDYKGGGQGPSTADEFRKRGLELRPGDPNRKLKIRQFHERLRIEPDIVPMMQVYDTCEQFIRTIPLIQSDATHKEDVDTKGEDHVYDEACHIMMARPVGDGIDILRAEQAKKKKEKEIEALDPLSKSAALSIEKLREDQKDEEVFDLFDY